MLAGETAESCDRGWATRIWDSHRGAFGENLGKNRSLVESWDAAVVDTIWCASGEPGGIVDNEKEDRPRVGTLGIEGTTEPSSVAPK